MTTTVAIIVITRQQLTPYQPRLRVSFNKRTSFDSIWHMASTKGLNQINLQRESNSLALLLDHSFGLVFGMNSRMLLWAVSR